MGGLAQIGRRMDEERQFSERALPTTGVTARESRVIPISNHHLDGIGIVGEDHMRIAKAKAPSVPGTMGTQLSIPTRSTASERCGLTTKIFV